MAAQAGPDAEHDADPIDVARHLVLTKLAARACTRSELGRALQAKNVPPEAAEAVLSRMTEVGLVDDGAFAAEWVSSRQQRRHLSASALRRELQAKGVAREQIDEALESVAPEDEYHAAYALAARRLASTAGLPAQVRYRRLAGVLGRRGFGGGVVAQVLAEVLGSATADGEGDGGA